jgi:hypothetical protein
MAALPRLLHAHLKAEVTPPCALPQVAFDVCPHRYEPDPTHTRAPGEQQRLLDIQECFKIPTVEGFAFELNNRCACVPVCARALRR